MSSDAKPKETKSKSRSNQIPSNPSKNSGPTTTPTGSNKVSKEPSNSTFSMLDKLGINRLKKSTFKYVKSSPQTKLNASSTAARKACIDYALELFIRNLVVSGHLDPTKARQMRTPSMKGHIATMCDKILERRVVKAASPRKLSRKAVSTTRSSSRSRGSSKSKGKVQKWVVQPASPMAIITDKDTSKLATVGVENEKKSEDTGKNNVEFKSYESSTSIQEAKGLKMKRQKSAASVQVLSGIPIKLMMTDSTSQQKPTVERGAAKNVESSNQNLENREGQPEQRLYQPFSKVPSDFNISNTRLLSGHSLSERAVPKAPPPSRSVLSESRPEAEYSPFRSRAPLSTIPSNNATKPVQNGTVEETRQDGNANELASYPGTAKTLHSIINSNTSISTVAKDFQTVVDMKGFQNDEIAMEVEGRKLIFQASRPKRNDMNTRNVREVVDVPHGVEMENLKIRRRNDGFVVIEEHEAEQHGT